MKKILYTKFNSTRKPEFRIRTSIVSENDTRYVLKAPMGEAACRGIEMIKNNYQLLCGFYQSVAPVPFRETEDGLCFEFIEGRGVLENIDFASGNRDEIVGELQAVMDRLFVCNEENSKRFEMSEQFRTMFLECEIRKEEKSFRLTNLDSIFDNFVVSGDRIYCIDYEWVFDFDIPVRYVKYRALHYLYQDKKDFLARICDEATFLRCFSFDGEDIELFWKMERCFQQYVHGADWKYIYTTHFVKPFNKLNPSETDFAETVERITSLTQQVENLQEAARLTGNHVDNLNAIIEDKTQTIDTLNQMIHDKDDVIAGYAEYAASVHKAVRNPVYAAGLFCRKIKEKADRKADERLESHYDRKYGALIHETYDERYEEWIAKVEADYETGKTFAYNPKISILVPVYNVLDKHLIPCIESVRSQTYPNWELCLADDASTFENVRETLKRYEDGDKIKVVYRTENGHISRCTNSALEISTGEFVAFMDCDDTLSPNALYEVVAKLNEDKTLDYIYSDEDKIDDDGLHRHMPHFKPDWSPDTLLSHMYTSHLSVYRRSLAVELSGLRAGYEGAQDYDFTLRFTEQTDRIAHIPKILYHWRERVESTAGSSEAKPYILEANVNSKRSALKRRGIEADIERIEDSIYYRIVYRVVGNPKVSILIPSKDNYEICRRCIASVYDKSTYRNFEIVLVDNGSSEENRTQYEKLSWEYGFRYIYKPREFNFSEMCNTAAANATGEYYLFLNDDTEVVSEDWIERMLGQAQQKHCGAVGAKLLYPETGNIQHTGVINIAAGPTHAFGNMPDEPYYAFARNKTEYNYIAVTAACLMVSGDKFRQIGGFDESFAVTYNDVDLCFRLVEAGYYNVERADAVLLHYESVSRGNDAVDEAKMKRLETERDRLYAKHPQFHIYDPFYNPNLSQCTNDFTIDFAYQSSDFNRQLELHRKIVISDQVYGNLDVIRSNRIVHLEGWAFITNYRKNNDISTVVVLQRGDDTYYFDTKKVYRPDVAEIFKDEKCLKFIGFECDFPSETVPEGEYRVGLLCKNQMLLLENPIVIKHYEIKRERAN